MSSKMLTTRSRVVARYPRRRVQGGLVAGAFACSISFAGCTRDGAAKTQSPPPQVPASALTSSNEVLATIGDESITMQHIRDRAGAQIDQIELQYQTYRSKVIESALDSILNERLLTAEATKQGTSVPELVAAAVAANGEPTDADIAAWYKDNQARIAGRTLDQVRSQIVELLRQQRRTAAMNDLKARLGKEQKLSVQYEPYRLTFDVADRPALGKEGAPVTMVEFSDFQCPYCRGFAPTLRQVEREFGDKIRIVYLQDPITSIHPFALKAAEASLCAHDQGKFWELHDLMFSEQEKLAVTDLKEKARRIGLNGKKFDECLDSGRKVEPVQNDLAQAFRVGVKGTPTIYINGRELTGGRSFEDVSAAINKELARAKP